MFDIGFDGLNGFFVVNERHERHKLLQSVKFVKSDVKDNINENMENNMNITPTDGRPRTFTFTASGENVTQIGQSFIVRGVTIVSKKREYRHSNPSAYCRLRRPKKKHALRFFNEWRTVR